MSVPSFMAGPGTPGLVSVIIPTYNRETFIEATISSLLAQTYPHFEAIVVDDGSTDETRRRLARFDDPRIQYFYKENGGLSSARNYGLARSSGEFIAFLDSDDVWLPWKLATQVALFRRHPDVGLSFSDFTTIDPHDVVLGERQLRTWYAVYQRIQIERLCEQRGTLKDLSREVPEALRSAPWYAGNIATQMFLGNLVHPPTAMVRRDRLRESGPFQPDVTGNGGEDYHFYYRICQAGTVAFMDAATILYRVHPDQMSRRHSINEARADVRLVTLWTERHPPALPQSVIRSRMASAHGWLGYEELQVGNRRAAVRHLWRSLRLGGFRVRTMLLLIASIVPSAVLSGARSARRVARRVRFAVSPQRT